MNIRIRRGEARDIEILISFLHNLFALEKDFAIDDDKQRAGLQLLLEQRRAAVIFVAEADYAVAGMVTAQLVVSTATGGYSVLLEDMYVENGFRRLGIGSKLLGQVIAWGYEQGARRLQLVAARTNTPALRFYRQAGLRKSNMTALYGELDVIDPDI